MASTAFCIACALIECCVELSTSLNDKPALPIFNAPFVFQQCLRVEQVVMSKQPAVTGLMQGLSMVVNHTSSRKQKLFQPFHVDALM